MEKLYIGVTLQKLQINKICTEIEVLITFYLIVRMRFRGL